MVSPSSTDFADACLNSSSAGFSIGTSVSREAEVASELDQGQHSKSRSSTSNTSHAHLRVSTSTCSGQVAGFITYRRIRASVDRETRVDSGTEQCRDT